MEKQNMTDTQSKIYRYILDYVYNKGYPPSMHEIGAALGIKSTGTISNNLKKIEELGYIRRDPTKARTIEILPYKEETCD